MRAFGSMPFFVIECWAFLFVFVSYSPLPVFGSLVARKLLETSL